jgi:DNA-binding response OmpR family regulator
MRAYRLLLVDDDEENRAPVSEYLRLFGYKVHECPDGLSALEAVREETPDAVLLDVQMPGLDGFEVLSRMRGDPALELIPVLLMTSLGRTNLKVKGLDLGADDYLVKPVDLAELVARVRRALKRSARYARLSGKAAGDLSKISLAELLQTLEIGRKNARVLLVELEGEILLDQGRLTRARWRGFSGQNALSRILLVESGSFSIDFDRAPGGAEAEPLDLTKALIGGAVQADEIGAILEPTPGREAMLEVDGELGGFPEIAALGMPLVATALEWVAAMPGELIANARAVVSACKTGTLRSATRKND